MIDEFPPTEAYADAFDGEPAPFDGATIHAFPRSIPAKVARIEFPADIKLDLEAHYEIKGVIGARDLCVLYGPSGAGKTFVALALAFSIAGGKEFAGRRTKQSPVLYVGLEGQSGLRKRIYAAAQAYGDPGNTFAHLITPTLLCKGAPGTEGARTIVEGFKSLSAVASSSGGLIIVDTLNRAMAGDDENSAADISAFVGRLKAISEQTCAAVLVVHHCGKDTARGMRGSSALFAAADCVIVIDAAKCASLEKAKDGRDGHWFSYQLESVTLATDADGEDINTCIVRVDLSSATAAGSHARAPTGPAKRALDILKRMEGDGEEVAVTGNDLNLTRPEPSRLPVTFLNDTWRERCVSARLSDGSDKSQARAFQRARTSLVNSGHIGWHRDFVWLIQKDNR